MNKGKAYYKLFSINLLRFIKMHNLKPVSKGVHPVTNKNYWVFELDEQLSEILTTWSNNKESNQQNTQLQCKVGH